MADNRVSCSIELTVKNKWGRWTRGTILDVKNIMHVEENEANTLLDLRSGVELDVAESYEEVLKKIYDAY